MSHPPSSSGKRIRRRFRKLLSEDTTSDKSKNKARRTQSAPDHDSHEECAGLNRTCTPTSTSTNSSSGSGGRRSYALPRRNKTEKEDLNPKDKDTEDNTQNKRGNLRRSKSAIARIGTRRPSLIKKHLEQQEAQEKIDKKLKKKGGKRNKHDNNPLTRVPKKSALEHHSSLSQHMERPYTFWTSKPALTMFLLLGCALHYKSTLFVYAFFFLFLYQTNQILQNWITFIKQHDLFKEFQDLSLSWCYYTLEQANRFFDTKDRTRKAAVGLFINFYPKTSQFVGDYLSERHATMTQKCSEEATRLRNSLHNTVMTVVELKNNIPTPSDVMNIAAATTTRNNQEQ